MNCISCNFEHNGKYCPNCGERSGVRKITLHSILKDSFSSITEMDKGFLYNIKALTLHPKKITIDYVSGIRKGIFNPISFLILSVTLYVIIASFFTVPNESVKEDCCSKSEIEKLGVYIGRFIITYLKYFWVSCMIPFGIALKLVFRKYNLFEYLAISSFIIGQATLIAVLSRIVFRLPLILDPFVYLAALWLVYKIFKNKNYRIQAILKSITVFILFIIQFFIIIGIIGTVIYFYQ